VERRLDRAVTGPDGGYRLDVPGPGSYVLITSAGGSADASSGSGSPVRDRSRCSARSVLQGR